MFHYVYRITNTKLGKHYYGKRSSKTQPAKDIGVIYFSSSTDSAFILDQKSNPNDYKYKVVSVHLTAQEAVHKEIKLHNLFDVGVNPKFYNKAKQTSTGTDMTGIPQTEEHRTNMSIAIKTSNKVLMKNIAQTGIPRKEEHKRNMSVARKNSDKVKQVNEKLKKYANIYKKGTNELLFENVCITEFAKIYGYDQSGLSATARADRDKPNSYHKNRHYHKGVYARYTGSNQLN